MSVVSLLDVKILNNPTRFTDKYRLEITFECLESLQKDLEWKLTYVGSATSSDHDQELDSLLVGPIPTGVNKFIFEADPPNISKLPTSELLGVTVVLLTCAYDGREFVRVGYYQNNEYDSEELQNAPPKTVQPERLVRNMLAEKPRVTRFAIKWDTEDSAPPEFPPEQPGVDDLEDDEDRYAAEEAELEAAKEAALEGEEEEEDVEMGGVDDNAVAAAAAAKIDEGAESEDLEAESSGESDEEGDDEPEDDADVMDVEMTDVAPAAGAGAPAAK
ncbi:histone deposition protein Asf1 [Ascodesmis nigricans]|uniref:Histone chaperone n=1 Tax=Ascodesmis nigricans TaxID=341454 RepID=A0A4S2N3W0_9PEZI|nr:histone deposition protein Asf1 [Ascodesmis nigricans]